MQQRIMWTALPAGRTTDGLRVSVVVTPLLDPQQGEGSLGDFPDLLNWPATDITWRVAIGDADPVPADPQGPGPDSDLWTALFSSDTPVRPPEHPDYTQHLWWSYPVGHVVDFVQQLYQEVATSFPIEHPDVGALLDPALGLRPLAHLEDDGSDRRNDLIRQLEAALEEVNAFEPGPADPETDLLKLMRFHRPAPLGERPQPPRFDFHQAVALCREHPGLARRLGLIHDLLVPDDPAAPFPVGTTTVRAEPGWDPSSEPPSTDVLPATSSRIGADAFLAEPKDPSELVRGRLPLHTDRYRIVQVDPDGAALGLLQFARNLVLSVLRGSEDTPTAEPLPSLASAGFSVARTGHAPVVRETVLTGRDLHVAREAGNSLLLHAEDVTRGYRFDVWTSVTGQWHSLQHRISDYEFLSLPAQDGQVEISEEGFVVAPPTDREESDPEALYLQESLMRWDGWSLAAPRPGRTLLENDEVADAPETPSEGFPLVMRFRAQPGTLPRLRFGETYRFRARAVDVAGNSVELDGDDDAATERHPYLRFEPVAAPVTLLQAPRTEGETVDRIVLRSNFDANPDPGTAQRHIAPPAVTQRTAEEHGLYDIGSGVDPDAYEAIVAREAKTFDDVGTVDEDQWPESFQLPYFPQIPLVVPYLPDPLARGASLRGLPGAGENEVVLSGFDHGGGWPGSRPLRLVVEQGNAAPNLTTSDDERVLTVQLPKAEIVTVRLSARVGADDLDLSAIWRWMTTKPGVTAAQIDQWRSQAVRGLLWMLTPYRVLTLVHAVRQPLAPPEFTNLAAVRQPGDTFADLDDSISFHRKSTSRVDLDATWTEPVDEGTGGGAPAPPPWEREHRQVLEVPERVGSLETDNLDFILRQEFGDTKHRRITYEAVATSAFTEYFVQREQVTLSGDDVVVLPDAEDGIVEGSEKVSLEGTVFRRDEHYTIDYEAAQIARIVDATDGIPDGATVVVEYLPEPVTRISETPATVDIPSSARPPTPTVLYAIPTHRWSKGGAGLTIESQGEGGGLRIYLDRPLFRSGEGELIGVVLDPDPQDPDDDLAPYVTRWGFDPVYGPPPLPQAAPGANRFPLAADVGTAMILDENGAEVAVAGHEVGFDQDRGLWFCDVEVDGGTAFWPFIRLALASYQPTSLPGLHLSRVTLADFVQLTPDRYATLKLAPLGGEVDVSVLGPSVIAMATGPEPPRMAVMVEQATEGVDDDVLGWEPVPGHQPTPLEPERDPSGQTLWTGTVRLPAPRAGGGGRRLRLVIEEFELVPDSDDRTDPRPGAPGDREPTDSGVTGRGPGRRQPDGGAPGSGPGGAPRRRDEAVRGELRRVLYRDIVPLVLPDPPSREEADGDDR